MSTEVDDFLEHFGVRGMRWGISNANGSNDLKAERAKAVKGLRAIEKERTSLSRKFLPADVTISGAGARAQAAKKVLKLQEVKQSNGSTRLEPSSKTPKITPENKASYERQINRRAYAKYVGLGSVAAVSILAGGALISRSSSDPSFSAAVTKGSIYLAGAQVLKTSTVVIGIHRDIRDTKLAERETELNRTIRNIDRESSK